MPQVVKIIVMVVFILICVALTFLVLMQEGKQQGLGAIAGIADSYSGKNKGRSMEGKLEKITKICVVLFFVLAIVLNMDMIGY